jgi:hypothetical protein
MRRSITVFCGLLFWPYVVFAEISQEVQEAILVMQSLCLVKSELTIEAEAGGSLLILKRGVKVEGKYTEEEIPSLLTKLNDEINLMTEADKIRECTQPHIGKILDAILGTGGAKAKSSAQNYGQIVAVASAFPTVVSEGQRTKISVVAYSGEYEPISDAKVKVSAGGGVFTQTGSTVVLGVTDAQGTYTVEWLCTPCAAGYEFGVEVFKSGYVSESTRTSVAIK